MCSMQKNGSDSAVERQLQRTWNSKLLIAEALGVAQHYIYFSEQTFCVMIYAKYFTDWSSNVSGLSKL